MSSESLSAGISFATGLPRFVITTVSRLACTSSMTARQWILKEPAAIFFIFAANDRKREIKEQIKELQKGLERQRPKHKKRGR